MNQTKETTIRRMCLPNQENGHQLSSLPSYQVQGDKTKILKEPKQPLSAYNIFFQVERQRILAGTDDHDRFPISLELVQHVLDKDKSKPCKRVHKKTHGKIGFQQLARTIGARWKALDQGVRRVFKHQARIEKEAYLEKRDAWRAQEASKAVVEMQLGNTMTNLTAHQATLRNSYNAREEDWEPVPTILPTSMAPLDFRDHHHPTIHSHAERLNHRIQNVVHRLVTTSGGMELSSKIQNLRAIHDFAEAEIRRLSSSQKQEEQVTHPLPVLKRRNADRKQVSSPSPKPARSTYATPIQNDEWNMELLEPNPCFDLDEPRTSLIGTTVCLKSHATINKEPSFQPKEEPEHHEVTLESLEQTFTTSSAMFHDSLVLDDADLLEPIDLEDIDTIFLD